MCAVTASIWAIIGAVTFSMWAVTSYVYDAQALCRLLHPLTLTLTTIKVQCMARTLTLLQ